MIPRHGEPLVDRNGQVTRSWRNYLSQLGNATSISEIWEAIREIRQQLAESGAGSFLRKDTTLIGVNGVQTLGQLSDGLVRIQLQGDEPFPSPRQVYGIRDDESRGYMSFADMVAVGAGLDKALDYGPYDFQGELPNPDDLPGTVVVGDAYLIQGDLWVGADEGRPDDPQWENAGPASPAPVLALEPLPDAGGGALVRTQRDQYGRVAGTSPALLNDLSDVSASSPESGQALVFDGSQWSPGSVAGGFLPMVNGEVPPVLMHTDDGSLIYARVE